jgi:cytidyltransferase-like protein
MLDQAGLTQYRGYSVLPGLEMPQQMYAWDYLPEENLAIRYTGLYHHPERVFLSENYLYESIINNGMFHAVANAYLIDVCPSGSFYEWKHVTTSVDRGEEYAIATIIQKDGTVLKKSLYAKGNKRIQALMDNSTALSERGIHTVAMQPVTIGEVDGEVLLGCAMEYIQAPIAMNYLRGLIDKDKDLFIKETCRFLDMVLESGDEKQGAQDELGPVYEKALFDLVPLNCFCVDGEYVAFDQEYVVTDYPINAILARSLSIIYMGERHMEEAVPMSYFMKRYHLEEKWNLYQNLGNDYLSELRNRAALSGFQKKHQPKWEVINSNRQKINYSLRTYLELFVRYLDDAKDRKVYVFGSGLWARQFLARYGDQVEIAGLLDNNESKWGTVVDGYTVYSPQSITGDCKVIICVKQYAGIVHQLKKMGISDYGIFDPNVEVEDLLGTPQKCEAYKPVGSTGEPAAAKPYRVGYIAGVFDLFHVGHLNLLRRAKEQCEYLLVGVVSDEQAKHGKPHGPYVGEQERLQIVQACRYVDDAFLLPMMASGSKDVYRKYHFDAQFSGSDYEHDPDWLETQAWLRERGSELVFFPYTQSTSSTKLKAAIQLKADRKNDIL